MQAPTLALCGCPNGCVVLRFGYVTVHLPRATFLTFARTVEAMAEAVTRGAASATIEH